MDYPNLIVLNLADESISHEEGIVIYSKCSKNFNTFSLPALKENIDYPGWNSQKACQNSKQGRL